MDKKTPIAVALGAPVPTDGSNLPRLVATGRGALAEQILTIAFAAGIKVRQDADLAELLSSLDLDTPIPPEAVVAVAEILEKVFEANGRMSGQTGDKLATGQ